MSVPAGSSAEAVQRLEASSLSLWSLENPCLHTLRSEITRGGIVADKTDTNIGICSIVAVGNSNPVSEGKYIGNQRRVHEGRAMAVIRSSGEPGEIVLTAAADGIPPVSVTIQARRQS
ncbi:MAG: hypothetical protein ACPL4E_09340 [Thermoproteota archaeon]